MRADVSAAPRRLVASQDTTRLRTGRLSQLITDGFIGHQDDLELQVARSDHEHALADRRTTRPLCVRILCISVICTTVLASMGFVVVAVVLFQLGTDAMPLDAALDRPTRPASKATLIFNDGTVVYTEAVVFSVVANFESEMMVSHLPARRLKKRSAQPFS